MQLVAVIFRCVLGKWKLAGWAAASYIWLAYVTRATTAGGSHTGGLCCRLRCRLYSAFFPACSKAKSEGTMQQAKEIRLVLPSQPCTTMVWYIGTIAQS
jgi:hypothetical protein